VISCSRDCRRDPAGAEGGCEFFHPVFERKMTGLTMRAILSWRAPLAWAASLLLCLVGVGGAYGQPTPSAGDLIGVTPSPGAPPGALADRILYRSTGLNGEPIEVSGLVIAPAGTPPAGGRPVVAWAHPTTGVIERCAPSQARVRYKMIPGLQDMLARGYVVVATDYPGLGTIGPHPYLVGISEGRAVLDSVRAVQHMAGLGAGRRFVVWGHSQGGHAALFAGLLAASYAPELQLVGVAAAAPASELAALFKADIDSFGGRNLTAMTLWSWSRVYGAPIDSVVEQQALPVVNRLASECLESLYDVLVRKSTTRPLATAFLRSDDFIDQPPWSELMARNTPGVLPADIPVFLAQGTADEIVRPAITMDYALKLCRAGSAVILDTVAGEGHAYIGRKSATAAVAWMAGRFAGAPAPNDCAQLGA
jgi:acetyl esterase/lipase